MQLIPPDLADRTDVSVRWLSDAKVTEVTGQDLAADVETQKTLLAEIGVTARSKVGLQGENSYLWMVTDLALAELNAVSVVFPPEFNNRKVDDLIKDYGLVFYVASDAGPEALTQQVSGRNDASVLGHLTPGQHKARTVENDPYPVTDDDHSFVFSSGTSGAFKGMVISKLGVQDQLKTFCEAMAVSASDHLLLFMPFSSYQNRSLYYGALAYDVEIAVVPATQLMDGLKKFQPTFLVAPPIFYEAVEKSIRAGIKAQSGFVRAVLSALTHTANALRPIAGGTLSNAILKRLYGAAHNVFGGQMRVLVTGMAKIGTSTLRFYQSLGLPVLQVYGLTECGVVCVNRPGDNSIGTVGKPLPNNTVSIAEDGEICVRKPAPQTSRFFHFEATTEDTRYEDGGVYTGDLGHLASDGTLTLVGRKKSTIVGHTGVKVQPEPLEKTLEEHSLITTAVLVGLEGGRTLGVVLQSPKMLQDQDRQSLEETAKSIVEAGAASFKNHLVFAHTAEDFTTDNGLLTRNLKINRSAVQKTFFPQSNMAS